MKKIKTTNHNTFVASGQNLGSNAINGLVLIEDDGYIKNQTIFPEEVLEKMFENLCDPEDIHNVMNASPQFRRILKPRQTADLFGLVLPHITTLLRTDDILDCRLVCKSWKSAVRYLLHDHPSVRPYDPKNDHIKNPISNIHTDITDHFRRFSNPTELGVNLPGYFNIVALRRYMKNHKKNPFVHERVVALTTTFNMTSDAWKHTFKFLKSHGRYISHFKMYCQDYDNSFVQFYKIMQRCIKLLPNSKTLEFHYDTLGDDHSENMCTAHDRHEDDDKAILQNIIDKYELPPLPKLDTLIMIVLEPYKSQYQRMILENLLWNYEDQLKKIHVSPVLWFARFTRLECLRHTLTELHVETNRSLPALIIKLLWTFRGYSTLRKLSFSFDSYTENINFSSIMEALDGIKSVQYLTFYGYLMNPINSTNGTGVIRGKLIQLPNVRTLEISSIRDEFIYDTILACLPALEYLKIENYYCRMTDSYNDKEVGIFELFKGLQTRKLYKSRIWHKLSCLKEIICSELSIFSLETVKKWRPNHQPGDPTHFVRFTRDRFESLKGN